MGARKKGKAANQSSVRKAPKRKRVPQRKPAKVDLPSFVRDQLFGARSGARDAQGAKRTRIRASGSGDPVKEAARRINSASAAPMSRAPGEMRESVGALKSEEKRFHGARISLAWFPWSRLSTPCGDRFGYMTPDAVRAAFKIPVTSENLILMDKLGELMGNSGRETMADSPIPAGFTYVGQFVDHDITLDVSSTLDTATSATTVRNMRSPALDLDSVYGDGPALNPFLYVFPSSGPPTAIKLLLGSNRNVGTGGPAGPAASPGAMVTKTDFDVPRASTQTAIIGDPRNDENLIVSQFHHTMLRFHNRVVDSLVAAGFTGDIFVEARRIVTHHYQWAVVNDFLKRVCGQAAVTNALASVNAPVGSEFRMPVEFSVAAYRFGHSMIRDVYWVNFNFPFATLGQVFAFARVPNLPVLSNWVVDFNALFQTGIPVPIFNNARKIDSVLASGLESLPGFSGMMAVLAQRNLRRGVALGLPTGQGIASFFGVAALTAAELQQGLPPDEVAVLGLRNGFLLRKTPLWYYVLREAAVRNNGDQLGPVGARIVADTFVRILKRDATSFLRQAGGFVPSLPSAAPGDFTFADLVTFAGVTTP